VTTASAIERVRAAHHWAILPSGSATAVGEHVARLAAYEAKAPSLRSEHRGDQNLPYWLMTLSYGRHLSAALIAWADETLAALSKRRRV